MTTDNGRSPLRGSGSRPTDGAASTGVSTPDGASIPNAGPLFSPAIYSTCPICYGSREAFGGQCSTCADPAPALARKVLERLRQDQIRFLRAFGHTLANQPVTGAEWDEYALCGLYVEDDDGVPDDEDYGWLIPPTRRWFASSQASMRYGSLATFIRYNPLGLLLRECLMAGADAMVPAPASGIEAATADETRSGSAEGESPAPVGGDAQTPPPESSS